MDKAASPALSPEQRRRFDDRGLVRLPGLVSQRASAEMADRLWAEMTRKDGVQRKAPATWTVERPAHFKNLQDTGAFKAMGSPGVRAALDDLMGAGRWAEPATWGLPLVCFPGGRRVWDVPFQSWHLDGPADPGPALVGRVFLILEPLRPQGGGTLVALGSHRLARRLAEKARKQFSSGEIRKRLAAEHPWFAALMAPSPPGEARTDRFMRPTQVGGIECEVAEMTGDPGDVWLMHPNILHAGAPNVLDRPRLALTQFVMPKG
ncbi:MAG TPA: phytanoyl-CoA dioxygenase family protein [Phenylobacterium sp.]|jgi:hypothetical protein|uniref:phytanoyl-CoA dioxygenase family protein n=1 Tax=Phenylobacterium sp. TaxID=1871053 RepID=UPI002D439D66|nr:phytanoyl-CoA dioxygenase family protein [Phenylobacterium sp.]HZZ67547.1 phytanoyl-CoA dioxygenase family protein [Phenylobacterium sp.]